MCVGLGESDRAFRHASQVPDGHAGLWKGATLWTGQRLLGSVLPVGPHRKHPGGGPDFQTGRRLCCLWPNSGKRALSSKSETGGLAKSDPPLFCLDHDLNAFSFKDFRVWSHRDSTVGRAICFACSRHGFNPQHPKHCQESIPEPSPDI